MLDELGPTFVKFGQLLSTRPTSSRRTSSSSCASSRTTSRPFRSTEIAGRDQRRARADGRAGVPLASTSARSRRPRSARCTVPRSRTATTSSSRCSGRDAPRQIESDLALMRSAASFVRGPRAVRSTSSTPRRSSTSSAARSARSSTTCTRRATPRRSGATSARSEHGRRPEGVVAVHDAACAHARVPRRGPACATSTSRRVRPRSGARSPTG